MVSHHLRASPHHLGETRLPRSVGVGVGVALSQARRGFPLLAEGGTSCTVAPREPVFGKSGNTWKQDLDRKTELKPAVLQEATERKGRGGATGMFF